MLLMEIPGTERTATLRDCRTMSEIGKARICSVRSELAAPNLTLVRGIASLSVIRAVAKKEFLHILNDRRIPRAIPLPATSFYPFAGARFRGWGAEQCSGDLTGPGPELREQSVR
jgi:hypothetical protein